MNIRVIHNDQTMPIHTGWVFVEDAEGLHVAVFEKVAKARLWIAALALAEAYHATEEDSLVVDQEALRVAYGAYLKAKDEANG